MRRGISRSLVIFLFASILLSGCLPIPPVDEPASTATRRASTPAPSQVTPAQPGEGTSTPEPPPTQPPVRRVGVQPEQLSGVEIQFWHAYSGAAGEALKQLVAEFNAANEWKINVKVVAVPDLSSLGEQIEAKIESGDPPDLTAGFLHQALAWDAGRPLADLQLYADDPEWGYSAEQQADFYQVFWQAGISDDRRLGMPYGYSAQVLVYNTSWARELGFETAPAIPQQFADQACAAADANLQDENLENDGSGGLIVSTHYATALNWIYSFGGEILNPAASDPSESVYRFNDRETRQAFEFLHDLRADRCAWVAETSYSESEFAARQGLFATVSLIDLPYLAQAVLSTGRGDRWQVVPFPSPGLQPGINTYGPSLMVMITSPQRQLAAWLLAKWLLEPANHARLVESAGVFPVRQSEVPLLEGYRSRSPGWGAAVDQLGQARSEPAYASWGLVRWAVEDAFTQLFRSYFEIEQLPAMLNYLDRTAAELHGGPDAVALPTPTSTGTSSP